MLEVNVNSAAEREAAAALLGARDSALSGGTTGSGGGPPGESPAKAESPPAQAELPLPLPVLAAALRGKMSDPRSSLASTTSGVVLAMRSAYPGTPGTPAGPIRVAGAAAAAHAALLPAAAGAVASGTALDALVDAGDAAARGDGGLRAIVDVALASLPEQEVRARPSILLYLICQTS